MVSISVIATSLSVLWMGVTLCVCELNARLLAHLFYAKIAVIT